MKCIVVFCGEDSCMKTASINDIKTNDAVEIEILYNGKRKSFPSVAKEFIDDSVLISPIMVGTKAVGFPDELKTRFSAVIKGTPYVWDDPKVRLVKYAGEMYHMVTIPGEGNYVNRRQAYRQYVGAEMPITLTRQDGERDVLTVLVKDLSETGVGIVSDVMMNVEDSIRLRISDAGYLMSINAVIVRIQEDKDKRDRIYGCQFTEKIPKLSQYIMQIQRDRLRASRTV